MFYTNLCDRCVSNIVLGIRDIYNCLIIKEFHVYKSYQNTTTHTIDKYTVSNNRIISNIIRTTIRLGKKIAHITSNECLYFLKEKITIFNFNRSSPNYFINRVFEYNFKNNEIFESEINYAYFRKIRDKKNLIYSTILHNHKRDLTLRTTTNITKKIKYKNKIILRKSSVITDGLEHVLQETYRNPKNTATIIKYYFEDGKLKKYVKLYDDCGKNGTIKHYYKNGNINKIINYVYKCSGRILMCKKFDMISGKLTHIKFRPGKYKTLQTYKIT